MKNDVQFVTGSIASLHAIKNLSIITVLMTIEPGGAEVPISDITNSGGTDKNIPDGESTSPRSTHQDENLVDQALSEPNPDDIPGVLAGSDASEERSPSGDRSSHISRAEWQKKIHDQNLDHRMRGEANYTPGVGTFLPPDTIMSPDVLDEYWGLNTPLSEALHNALIKKWRQPTVTTEASLSNSPYFRDLVEGNAISDKELRADPVVYAYLLDREHVIHDQALRLKEQYPQIASQFREGINLGVREGYIPALVLEHLDEAIELTALQVVDSAKLKKGGEYDASGDRIILNLTEGESDEELHEIVIHELLHKVSGGTFTYNEGSQKIDRPRGGLVEAKNGQAVHTGLEEALIHHLTIGLITGDFSTLDPEKRQKDSEKYYEIRKLLTAFIVYSNGIIDVKSLTRALFEDSPQTTDRRQMQKEVRQAYGSGALRKADSLFVAMGQLDKEDPNYVNNALDIMGHIIPPSKTDDGNIQPGHIEALS